MSPVLEIYVAARAFKSTNLCSDYKFIFLCTTITHVGMCWTLRQ